MILPRSLEQQIGPMTPGRLVTDDGVQLLFQTFGPTDGPAIVFANGIGVRYPGVVRQVNALRSRHRIVCWDYRGMGQSAMPDPARGDVSMARHARDALAVLAHLAIERAIFVGWSMGVQVSLEVWRQAPRRMAGFVALLGTYRQPFRTAFPAPVAAGIELLFSALHDNPRVAQAALDFAVALPRLSFALLSRLSFVGADADPTVFDANVRSVAGVEKALYTRTMLELARHDASDVLGTMTCPALIIAGERDHLTPPKVARHMVETIPGAAYREVQGGTHFAMIEQPELINSWLVEFAGRVYAGDRPAAAP